MDRVIASYPAQDGGALRLCEEHGVAYQSDMRYRPEIYDAAYYAKVHSYDPTIEAAVLRGRLAMLAEALPARASVVDWGAGNGAFVRAARAAGFDCRGYDVMASTVQELQAQGIYTATVHPTTDALTLWDTLEHLEYPSNPLCFLRVGAMAFLSLPIFEKLADVPSSKHYRPGEHLYYWTRKGLLRWMAEYGFTMVRESDHEVRAGRTGIGAFVFIRTGWGA